MTRIFWFTWGVFIKTTTNLLHNIHIPHWEFVCVSQIRFYMFKFDIFGGSNDSHFECTNVQYLETLEPTFMQFPLKEAFETNLVSVFSCFIFSFCQV